MAKTKDENPKQASLFKKKVPDMPEGYYSGDKPNPNLRAFVEAHLKKRPYDPGTDAYDLTAFDKPIETTKAKAIYNMHTYWSKKPHDAIRQYILHYTKPGDLVLDPLCGSGGTALAALLEGRKAIAIDRSPAATFITKNYCTPVDVYQLREAFDELKNNVEAEIDWLYGTRCDRCGGKATTSHTVYSEVFQCPRCLVKVPLFDCIDAEGKTAKGKPRQIKVCPNCHARGIEEEISTRSQRLGAVPVMVSYLCEAGCKPARDERQHNDLDKKKREYFKTYDLAKISEIESREIPHWYPSDKMMHAPEGQARWGILYRPGSANMAQVSDLFTCRNLWATSSLLTNIPQLKHEHMQSHILFVFQASLLSGSRMQQYHEGGGGFARGTYFLPPMSLERNVLACLERKFRDYISALNQINSEVKSVEVFISTESATNMSAIISSSIDYVFTDPPYSWKVQFGELNFIWEAFLSLDTTWHAEEIIVNEVRGKTETDWANMMYQAMSECYRVLKPGRWLSLCYHDTSEGTWALIQDIMAEVGFLVDKAESAIFIDTAEKSWKQRVADKVSKRDLVINFRKPKSGEVITEVTITGYEDQTTFNEKIHTIIREHLEMYPGTTKDRIYDEVVSCMVRSGSMEPHNFEELLRQVADEVKQPVMKDLFTAEDPNLFGNHEISRWYLKEVELDKVDAAESAKEDAAAQKMHTFIADLLQENPEQEGVHYSDLFEHYVYAVQDKTRRPLAEWLLDYFFKTESGTYRLPMSEEEDQLKAEGRAKGINRRIKRYLAYLEQSVTVPDKDRPTDVSLAEWIRHCKRSGLFEQGKLLYEKGGLNLDNLSEKVMVDVEEDYQVCVRMLARSTRG